MFDHIPVGVGSKGIIPMNARDLEEALEMGMDWSLREGIFIVSRYSRQHNQLTLLLIISLFFNFLQVIFGQKIKNIVKNMVECLMQILQKYQ